MANVNTAVKTTESMAGTICVSYARTPAGAGLTCAFMIGFWCGVRTFWISSKSNVYDGHGWPKRDGAKSILDNFTMIVIIMIMQVKELS